MLHPSLCLAAVTAALSASAAIGAAPTPAKPAAQQQQAPTRASLLKGTDSNFKSIDTNGDGTLSAAELAAAEGRVQQQRLAQLRQRFETNFTRLDTNKDGQLSRAEFIAAAPTTPATAPDGAKIVAQLDKNKDGKISADEYRAPILSRFDALDTNRDGVLSPAERQAAAAAAPRRP